MTDGAVRNWSDITEDEQAIIKLLYVNGVHSLAQMARIWSLNYNGLIQVSYKKKWAKEKDECEVSVQQNWLAHTKFMQRVGGMMEVIHQGYEDLLMRHQIADSFEAFPFEPYFAFLETYAKMVTSLGGVKPVSSDMNLFLQQNNTQTNVNLGNGQDALDGPAVASITDKSAKVMLRKVLENIVLSSKPPRPAEEVPAQLVQPENEPDPARGKFR